jgi:uncharacterized repeat protein (TIGR03803 family)
MKFRMWMWTTAACLFTALAIPVSSPAQEAPKPPNFSIVYTFTGEADGSALPEEQLALDREGNLYGTGFGGDLTNPDCGNLGCGVVFKIDRKGNESILHTFTGTPDGYGPNAGVTVDDWANVYGTTVGGGSNGGSGTVFRIDRDGNETILHSFTGSPDGHGFYDGEGLTLGPNHDIYGTTVFGGTGSGCIAGCGTVFKLDRADRETIVYNFNFVAAGLGHAPLPQWNLALDDDGNLYGGTYWGGAYGSGYIFKVDHSGNETVLYSFTGGSDGGAPQGVIRDCDGTLYGVTALGGNGQGILGSGVVFSLDRKGTFTVLHTFSGGADGGGPDGQLLLDRGDLYGTTYYGGNLAAVNCPGYGCGVVYKLNPAGEETVLYNFTGLADGSGPAGGLVQDAEGNLYGVTSSGGDLASSFCHGLGCGVVYKLSPPHN